MLTDLQATPSLNNNGDVAFSGIFLDDIHRLVLAQTGNPIPAIPEPSTMLLFG